VRRSLRTRVLVAVVVANAAVLAASGFAVYALMRASLLGEFTTALANKARAIAALVEHEHSRFEVEFSEREFPEFRQGGPECLELWAPTGEVLFRSASLRGRDLPRFPPGKRDVGAFRVTLPDGRPGRMVLLSLAARRDEHARGRPAQITVALARTTFALDRTLARLGRLLVAVCAAAAAASAALLAWLVPAVLRPVGRVAAQIERLGEDDLSARVAAPDAPRELAPVVERLNALLARLEAAFERERAFSADVAHELRTPLAGLRTTLEVALSGKRDPASLEEALRDSLAITCQTHAMVENLLAMARCEAGQVRVARESVRLDELLRECWRPFGEAATGKGLKVEWQVEEPLAVETDREKLRLILGNLLDNAVTHADAGGRVRIAASRSDGDVAVVVANTGSRLGPGEAARAFERFWRGDAARSDTGAHCGLGLTLSDRLARLLGASLEIQSVAGGEFVATLVLRGGGAAN